MSPLPRAPPPRTGSRRTLEVAPSTPSQRRSSAHRPPSFAQPPPPLYTPPHTCCSHVLLLFSKILKFFPQALPSVLRRRAQELQDSVGASSSDAATAHAPLAGGQPVRRAAAALSHGLISSRMLQQPPVQPAEPSVAQVQAGQAGGMRSRFGQA